MSEEPRYPETEGKNLQQRVAALEDYIVNLHRYIRYALGHIDANNMTPKTAKEFTGNVKFSDLAEPGKTEINGSNIKTGTIEAIDIRGCDIESEKDELFVRMKDGVLSAGGNYATSDFGANGVEIKRDDKTIAFIGINQFSGLPELEFRGYVDGPEKVPVSIKSQGNINIYAPDGYVIVDCKGFVVNGKQIG